RRLRRHPHAQAGQGHAKDPAAPHVLVGFGERERQRVRLADRLVPHDSLMTQIMTYEGRIAVYLAAAEPPGSYPCKLPSRRIRTGARGRKTCNYLSMSIAISEEHRALA